MSIFISRVSWYDVQDNKFGQKYNSKNHFLYSPYVGNNVIDTVWWNSLLDSTRRQILQDITPIFESVDVPHNVASNAIVEKAYLDSFDYHVWFHAGITNGPKNVLIIPLSAAERHCIFQNDFNMLRMRIIDANPSFPLFVRLSGTSGKNSIELSPLNSLEEVLTFLQNNKAIKRELEKEKETALILMPWNFAITSKYEFRLFIHNKKITAISQQYWYDLFEYDDEEIATIFHAINRIQFIEELPYESFVADVWIDMNEKTVKLIECNPFGAFSASGSALFNWLTDYDQLYGKNNKIEFRFTSLQSQ